MGCMCKIGGGVDEFGCQCTFSEWFGQVSGWHKVGYIRRLVGTSYLLFFDVSFYSIV